MSTRTAPVIPPPVIAGAAAGVQVLLSRGGRGTPAARIAAVLLGGASAALALWAESSFRAAQTSVNPLHPEHSSSLVTGGANRYTRNPMYLGMVGALAAHGLWRGSARAMLPAAGAWLWLDSLQIPAEERVLEEKYGGSYRQYQARVPRWI